MNRLVRFCTLAIILSLAFVGLAYAHAHLESATPPPNAHVETVPSQLTLTFSEGVNRAFTSVQVTGPDGKTVSTGKAKLKADSDKTLVVPLAATLAPGTYTVKWRTLSVDGHTSHGRYHFTVTGK